MSSISFVSVQDHPTLPPPHEYRIYGDDRATVYAVVDEADYQWAVQWLWNPKREPYGAVYLKRNEGPARTHIYLHVEIMKRKHRRPTRRHVADHKNGNTLDCRRSNLRWTTRAGNNRNRAGSKTRSRLTRELDACEPHPRTETPDGCA